MPSARFVFVQAFVGFGVCGFGVEEFDLLFQRSLRDVLIVIIHMAAVRKSIVKLRLAAGLRIRKTANVRFHPLVIHHRRCRMADGAHILLGRRTGDGVTFGTGRMRQSIRRSVFVAGVANALQIVLVFAEFVFGRRAVAVGAIQLSRLVCGNQTFDRAFVGFVSEPGELRRRGRTRSLRAGSHQVIAAPRCADADNEQNCDESFHFYRLG